MVFALGFLAAALIALLIIPAINARADRLARRRAEALFPLSISELTAQKDHLRAEFAVLQRRLERKTEEALAVKHQSMEELGRRAMRIEALETELAERETIIAELRADLADTAARLVATDEELTGANGALSGLRDTLSALEDAHRKTLDELGNTRTEFDQISALLASTKTDLTLAQDRLEAREVEFADLDARHSAALSELDTKRITISDLETRLAMQKSRGDDFERSLGERRRELEEERQRLADLAKTLLAEQERASALEREAAGLTESLKGSSGDIVLSLRKELDEARIRIASLEAEKRKDGPLPDEIRAENAELRRLIVEVADDVLRAADHEAPAAQERRTARG
jgi:DNA repair exonuclease SbcCD ATPase subunit